MFDGVDIKYLNLKSMRTNIGVVSQEPILFDMTIGENISFGAVQEVTSEDIENAARNANAHDFICTLPQVLMFEMILYINIVAIKLH